MKESKLSQSQDPSANRRSFLKSGGAVAAVGGVAGFPAILSGAPNTKKLKIGVVGCGGRGAGAMINALNADDNVELHAMGDLFRPAAEGKLRMLQAKGEAVTAKLSEGLESRIFDGIDAYEKVMDSGIDVVLCTTPPGFRPQHFRAAVDRGLHAFVEKPCATDVAGIRQFWETSEIAAAKGLSVLCGFCYRYSMHGQALFERIHDGAIGDILSIHSQYLAGPVKPMPPASQRPEGMSDTEWQARNWYNFTWLSGDGLVEQGCHNVDRIAWCFGDKPPVAAFGSGGRQRPNEEGNIYDHFSVTYEYPNNVKAHMEWRQFVDSYRTVGDTIVGTKGVAKFGTGSAEITGQNAWRWRKPRTGGKNMYDAEHEEFFAAIRSGDRKDDGKWVADSTLLAILGRNACYSGKRITWEEISQSDEKLVPDSVDMNGELPIRPMRIPGVV